MKDALSVQEFKALAQLFFNAGKKERDFERFFNTVMDGKYDKAIEQAGWETKWHEMNQEIAKHMDEWDREQKAKAAQVMEDLRNIIITA